ncbi:MAG: hypothetical protein IJH12_10895 [Clostridia bacterium]|nr:hypothetical protein [Clostridia bacterium]
MDLTIDIRYAYLAGLSVIIAIVVSVVYSILFMSKRIGMWKLFEKAGEKEWKSMVPIYNQITLLKMCKLKPAFILLYLDLIIPFIGYLAGRDVKWITIVMLVGFVIYRYMISIRIGQAFKKGDIFSFFLAFFPSILLPVLGCSKNEMYRTIGETKVNK